MMNSYSVAELINLTINESVSYKTDSEQYDTPEFWQEAGVFGNCEDTHRITPKHNIDWEQTTIEIGEYK